MVALNATALFSAVSQRIASSIWSHAILFKRHFTVLLGSVRTCLRLRTFYFCAAAILPSRAGSSVTCFYMILSASNPLTHADMMADYPIVLSITSWPFFQVIALPLVLTLFSFALTAIFFLTVFALSSKFDSWFILKRADLLSVVPEHSCKSMSQWDLEGHIVLGYPEKYDLKKPWKNE